MEIKGRSGKEYWVRVTREEARELVRAEEWKGFWREHSREMGELAEDERAKWVKDARARLDAAYERATATLIKRSVADQKFRATKISRVGGKREDH
jgi:hypothetical protein